MTVETKLSLREAAAEAWARHQAEFAEQKRRNQEAARARFGADLGRALRLLTSTYDPASPLTEDDINAALVELEETADGIVFAALVTFAGERFRYHPSPTSGGRALFHRFTCPACGAEVWSDSIISLAELGYWIEQAPFRCACRVRQVS